jgi:RNA polymerase sigma factor (sigma-70 family)
MAFWPYAAHYPPVTESQPGSGRVLKEEVDGLRSSRPPKSTERLAVAVEIASAGSTALRRHAARYSLCAADAEDACQRGLEILLTKAPTDDRAELRSWLFTVVKHEALALRRQRERAAAAGSAEDVEAFSAERADSPAERASGGERARRAAEALAHLKPAEIRCMLLKAMGFSYEEIAQRTGFSFTKVNRCLTEGRRTFLERFDRISAGAGCAELRPLLSAASDGECPSADRPRLQAHLDACAPCRAALRTYRETPARLAELLPPAALLPVLERGGWWERLTGWLDTGPAERVAGVAQKLHGNAELLSAKKTAAVMASTAVLAGGTAVEHRITHPRKQEDRPASSHRAAPRKAAPPVATVARPSTGAATSEGERAAAAARSEAVAKERRARKRRGEFSFEATGSSTSGESPGTATASASAAGASTEFAGPGQGGGAAASGGEFGP